MMIRMLVVAIGLIWASLLLVSWGGSTPVPPSGIQAALLETR